MPIVEEGGLSIAIIGATGCIGKELGHEIPLHLPIRNIHLFATKKRVGDSVSIENQTFKVQPFPGEGLPVEVMEDVDAVFFACPAALVLAHAPTLAEEGIAVFDLTGAMSSMVGYSAFGLAPNEERFSETRVCSFPSPTATALARVFRPLKGLGAWGFQANVTLSASRFGMGGIEELSQQVMALFSTSEPKKKVFPNGLAFDILPVLGAVQEDGNTSAENKVNAELANLLHIGPQYFRTTINLAPIFSGISCNVTISMGTEVSLTEVIDRLKDEDLLTVDEVSHSTRDLIGDKGIVVSRIRENSLVRGFDLWVGCDNVATTVHQAVKMMEYYHLVGLL